MRGFLLAFWAMPFVVSAASNPEDAKLLRQALQVSAASLLRPAHQVKNPEIPLRGTIQQYVRNVVHTNGVGEITKTRIVACKQHPHQRCVEIVGEACPGKWKQSEECEGMYLTIRVNLNGTPKLDSGIGPSYEAIRDQSDIERALEIAP